MLSETGPPVGGARRALDVAVALIALLVATPLLLVAVIAILWTSPGPALFRQIRVGAGGRPFTILKLRTMSTGTTGPDITLCGDPRVTRVGEVLRRTSIDELPQLFNVLRGQMTLVGPRPETLDLASRYPRECRWVLQHTPGLTGPAQVRLRDARVLEPPSGTTAGAVAATDPVRWYLEHVVPRRVSLDASYLQAPSMSRTLSLLVETGVYLLRGS